MSNAYKISYKFKPLFSTETLTIIEDSGRSSGKTTTAEMAMVAYMRESPLNNIMYCRAEAADLNKNYNSLLATIQDMGVDSEFKWISSPFRIWNRRTGATCYFLAVNGKVEADVNATKGFVPQRRSLKMFVVDEANEVRFRTHLTAAKTTAEKFLLPGAKIVYAWNPPPTKNHWVHSFRAEELRNGATRIYTTWQDIREVLKPATILEIERMRDNDPLFYRYWYLGEVVNFSGMVYPQFRREKHIVNFFDWLAHGDAPVELCLGLDEGTVNDSTCVTPLCIMRSGRAIVLDLYEYSPTDRANNQDGERGSLSPSEQARRLWQWLGEFLAKFPQVQWLPRRWIFECAEGGQMLRAQFAEDYGEETVLVQNKSIWGDVKRVRNMLSEGLLFFHCAPNVNTETLVSDIENYVIDDRTNDIKKDQREDSIDSLEYATKLYFDIPV